jgi:hypothetical protein
VWNQLENQGLVIDRLWIQLPPPPAEGNWTSVEGDDNVLLHIMDLTTMPTFSNLEYKEEQIDVTNSRDEEM